MNPITPSSSGHTPPAPSTSVYRTHAPVRISQAPSLVGTQAVAQPTGAARAVTASAAQPSAERIQALLQAVCSNDGDRLRAELQTWTQQGLSLRFANHAHGGPFPHSILFEAIWNHAPLPTLEMFLLAFVDQGVLLSELPSGEPGLLCPPLSILDTIVCHHNSQTNNNEWLFTVAVYLWKKQNLPLKSNGLGQRLLRFAKDAKATGLIHTIEQALADPSTR